MKEKALELADLKKKLEEADNDIKTKDADIVEKVKEIESLKALIKVPHSKILDIDIINSIKDANETIEVRNGELDAKTDELKSVMKKLVDTNAELSKVTLLMA